MNNQIALFDYQTLDTETRIVVSQRTSEIKTLVKRSAQDVIEIGQKLIEVKMRLGHGRFSAWLEAEFEWTDRTARNFMRVGETFNSENFSEIEIAPSALYLLAAAPDDARAEAITRARGGERITHSTAKDIVAEYTPPPVAPALLLPVEELEERGGTFEGVVSIEDGWVNIVRGGQGFSVSPGEVQSGLILTEMNADRDPAEWAEDDDAGEDPDTEAGQEVTERDERTGYPMTEAQAAAGLDRLAADLAEYKPEVGELTNADKVIEIGQNLQALGAGLADKLRPKSDEAPPVDDTEMMTPMESTVPTPAPLPPPPVVRAAPWGVSVTVYDGSPPLVTIVHGSATPSLLPAEIAAQVIEAIRAKIEPAPPAIVDAPEVPVRAPDWLIPRGSNRS